MMPTEQDLCGADGTPVEWGGHAGTVPVPGGVSSEEILRVLIEQVHRDGLVVYSRVLLDAEVSVVSVYVPGLERFGFVTRGNLVMPTGIADERAARRRGRREAPGADRRR